MGRQIVYYLYCGSPTINRWEPLTDVGFRCQEKGENGNLKLKQNYAKDINFGLIVDIHKENNKNL